MISRRRLLQASLALPLIAAERAPPGVDWNAWFRGWLPRDFGMIGYYAKDNAALLASGEPVDIVFMGDFDHRRLARQKAGLLQARTHRSRYRWAD